MGTQERRRSPLLNVWVEMEICACTIGLALQTTQQMCVVQFNFLFIFVKLHFIVEIFLKTFRITWVL